MHIYDCNKANLKLLQSYYLYHKIKSHGSEFPIFNNIHEIEILLFCDWQEFSLLKNISDIWTQINKNVIERFINDENQERESSSFELEANKGDCFKIINEAGSSNSTNCATKSQSEYNLQLKKSDHINVKRFSSRESLSNSTENSSIRNEISSSIYDNTSISQQSIP